MIRPANPSDRDGVIRLLKAFHAEAGLADGSGPTGFSVPYSAAFAERLFRLHVEHPDGICLVLDVDGRACGVLMATASEHPFGALRIAKETIWWIDPTHRGRAAIRMLDAYDEWARKRGCAFAGMAGLGGDPAVGRLYERRGYLAAETHFLKRL